MKAVVHKWGNSLAIRIPRNISSDANVTEGSCVYVTVENGSIVLTPSIKDKSLEELLKRVDGNNIHSEVSTGNNTGGEIW